MQEICGGRQKHGYRDGSSGAGENCSRATHATLSLFPRDKVFTPATRVGLPAELKEGIWHVKGAVHETMSGTMEVRIRRSNGKVTYLFRHK